MSEDQKRIADIRRAYYWVLPPLRGDSSGVTMHREKADILFLLDRLHEYEQITSGSEARRQYIHAHEKIRDLKFEVQHLKDMLKEDK